MHPLGPLKTNHRAFYPGQQIKRQCHTANRYNRRHQDRLSIKDREPDVEKRNCRVTGDQNGQISRAVIGAMVHQILPTDRTMVADLQITFEHGTRPAVWAFPAPAAFQRAPDVPVFDQFIRYCWVSFRVGRAVAIRTPLSHRNSPETPKTRCARRGVSNKCSTSDGTPPAPRKTHINGLRGGPKPNEKVRNR